MNWLRLYLPAAPSRTIGNPITRYSCFSSSWPSSSLPSIPPSSHAPCTRNETKRPCKLFLGITYSLMGEKSRSVGVRSRLGLPARNVPAPACRDVCAVGVGRGGSMTLELSDVLGFRTDPRIGDGLAVRPSVNALAEFRPRGRDRDRDADRDLPPSSDPEEEINRSGTWYATVGPRIGSNFA